MWIALAWPLVAGGATYLAMQSGPAWSFWLGLTFLVFGTGMLTSDRSGHLLDFSGGVPGGAILALACLLAAWMVPNFLKKQGTEATSRCQGQVRDMVSEVKALGASLKETRAQVSVREISGTAGHLSYVLRIAPGQLGEVNWNVVCLDPSHKPEAAKACAKVSAAVKGNIRQRVDTLAAPLAGKTCKEAGYELDLTLGDSSRVEYSVRCREQSHYGQDSAPEKSGSVGSD